MGDRSIWYEDCPKCNGKDTVEVADDSSSLIFYRKCNKCGWTDGLGYYEGKNDDIILCTKEEAIKLGLIYLCGCGEYKTWWEKEVYGTCVMCTKFNKSKEGDTK